MRQGRFINDDRVKSCWKTSKSCLSKKDAQTKRNRLQTKHGRERLRIYPCPHCNWWHLSNLEKRIFKQRP